MIESCSFRRMVIAVIVCIMVSVLVFIFENRLEENLSSGETVLKKLISWRSSEVNTDDVNRSSSLNVSHPRNIAIKTPHLVPVTEIESFSTLNLSSASCYRSEPFTVLEECVKCSQFEIDALRRDYCLESGYYDKLNCTSSGKLGLRACYSKGDYASVRFSCAMILWMLTAIISYVLLSWRRQELDKRAYLRVQQQLAS